MTNSGRVESSSIQYSTYDSKYIVNCIHNRSKPEPEPCNVGIHVTLGYTHDKPNEAKPSLAKTGLDGKGLYKG
jgi:hypothetical protein